MLSRQKVTSQLGFFNSLQDQLDQKHPLYLLANLLNWSLFEDHFKKHYSEKMGKPAKPIRLMVALLILKHVRNLSVCNELKCTFIKNIGVCKQIFY